MAIRANPRLKFRDPLLFRFSLDPVYPAELLVNVFPCQVGIDLEHCRMHRTPHHHLDNTFRDPFVDEMSNPGVAEEMWGDMLSDSSAFAYPAELFDDPAVGEWSPLLIKEDQCISLRGCGIISPPLGEISLRHDDPDVSRNPGLEVHIGDHARIIKGEIAPLHLAKLTDPKSTLVEHSNKGPVPTPAAGRQKCLHLFGSKEISGLVSHGILGGDLDSTDFPLREIGILIFDHPEKELPEDPDPVVLRVLFEWRAFLSEAILHRVDAGIHIGDRELVVRPNEPSPSDKDVDELVRPAGTDIGGYLSLCDKLFDEISITLGYPVRCQSSIDRVHPILGFDTGETV